MRAALLGCASVAIFCSMACEDAFEVRVDELAARVAPPLYECPDRIWPGAAFGEGGRIVFHSASARRAIALSGLRAGHPRLDELDFDAVPLSLRENAYDFGELAGEPAVGISLDETAVRESRWLDPAAGLTLHESFHLLSGQRAWTRADDTTRFVPYPASYEPRFLRQAMMRALRGVVLHEEGAALGHAAFWLERYTTEESDDAARTRDVDRIEGSAQYFQIVAMAVAELGCGANDEALEATALLHVDELLGAEFEPDSESYAIGLLAGLLLRRGGAAGWQAEVEGGATIAELALRGTPPVSTSDPTLEMRAVEAIADWNERTGRIVDPFVAALDDPNAVRVSLPATWVTSGSLLRPFVILRDVPGTPQLVTGLSAAIDGGDVRGRATRVPAIMGSWSVSPCGASELDAAFVFPIRREQLVSRDDVYSISSAGIELEGYRGVERTSDGAAWLCPAP